MKKNKKALITAAITVVCVAAVVLTLVLIFKNDNKDDAEFNESEQIALERAGADSYTSPVLIIMTNEDEMLGVTQLGNLVYVDNPDGLAVRSGVVASNMQVTVDENGDRHGTLKYPYVEATDLPLYASQSSAPDIFTQKRMGYLMNNATESAVTDYKINSVVVTDTESGAEGTAIITFEIDVDIVPWRNSKMYGNPDADGWCRGRTYEFRIWGTNGTWFLKGDDPITKESYDYGDSTDGAMRTFETQLFINDDYSFRFACFEQEDMSILNGDVPIRTETPDSEEANDDTSDEETPTDYEMYYTELYALDVSNESAIILERGQRDFQYVFKDQYDGMLYLQTKEWTNSTEGNNRYLCVVDTNDMTFRRIVEYSLVIASTDDTMYVLGKRLDDDTNTARNLFAIDILSGDILWESQTPYDVTTENYLVCLGVRNGYLHVMYAADRIPFAVSESSGTWSYDLDS